MNTLISSICFLALLCAPANAQTTAQAKPQPIISPPLDQEISHFELEDGSIIDGLAELSRSPNLQLHLGIEEVLREKLASPRDRSVHFALRLDHRTVREILDALCASDPRYAWSVDGNTINVSPQARVFDQTDLLNFRITELHVVDIPDPDQALTPLSKQFPAEPIGYMQMGGDNSYAAPWSAVFEDCTVREFINRVAEHMGVSSTWVWQGGKDNRMFTFVRGGFYARQRVQ